MEKLDNELNLQNFLLWPMGLGLGLNLTKSGDPKVNFIFFYGTLKILFL